MRALVGTCANSVTPPAAPSAACHRAADVHRCPHRPAVDPAHGAFSFDEAFTAGLTRSALRHQLATQRLVEVQPRILARPELVTRKTELLAAVRSVSPTVLTAVSAAELLGLCPPAAGDVHVDVGRRRPRPRDGVKLHFSTTIARGEVVRVDGIPCVDAPRALLEMATLLDRDALEQAAAEGDVRGSVTLEGLKAVLVRAGGHVGAAAIRWLIDEAEHGLTRSWLEREVRALLRRATLADGMMVNLRSNGRALDFHWPADDLVLEVDGFAWHGRRRQFEHDADRDLDLEVTGRHVLRASARQVRDTPEKVVAAVAGARAERRTTRMLIAGAFARGDVSAAAA